jgi:hypothetical protein
MSLASLPVLTLILKQFNAEVFPSFIGRGLFVLC